MLEKSVAVVDTFSSHHVDFTNRNAAEIMENKAIEKHSFVEAVN